MKQYPNIDAIIEDSDTKVQDLGEGHRRQHQADPALAGRHQRNGY